MGESAARRMLAVEDVHNLVERGVDNRENVLHNAVHLLPGSAQYLLRARRDVPRSKDRTAAAPKSRHSAQARRARVHAHRGALPSE